MGIVAGLDIGGAHCKAARLEAGRLTGVVQHPCPLWEGIDRLDGALKALAPLTAHADWVAITMTAELTEIFDSREAGAITLIKRLHGAFGDRARFFMGLKGMGRAQEALRDPNGVGSANFLATARIVAQLRPHVLLIDMGSTTTDIIACDRPQGLTDADRLQTGELVYTGFTRTAVPSVTARAPLLGTWQTLARDSFATMADVRRLLGVLPEGVDQHDTADGRSKSVDDSLRRFARGFGRDGEMRHLSGWQSAAAYVRECQLRSIYDGAIQVLSRPGVDVSGGVVAAGIGAEDARELAKRLGLPCATFGDIATPDSAEAVWATRCAPAVAVAMLARRAA